jgi:hypothetical protein
MKIKSEQLENMAQSIFAELVSKKMIKVLSSPPSVIKKIAAILLADAHKEEEIENEARKMMAKFEAQIQSGEIDYHKMYTMIKKQLMKDKKFTP